MNRRLFLNLALLVVVALLALLVWYASGPGGADEEERLTGLRAAEISTLIVRRPDGEELRFRREGDGWEMRAPIATAANGFRVDPLVRVVEARSHAAFDAAGLDLGRYGLEPARAQIAVDGRDIAFGGTEPIDRRRYVLFSGRVHLIDDHYFHRLQPDFPAFVSNALLPGTQVLRSIDLPGLSLRRDEDGRWMAEPTGGLPDEAGGAAGLAQEWQRAQGIEVVRYLGGAAEETIRVGLGDGATIEFEVLDDGDGLLLARRDLGIAWRLTDVQAQRLLPQDAPEAGAGDP